MIFISATLQNKSMSFVRIQIIFCNNSQAPENGNGNCKWENGKI